MLIAISGGRERTKMEFQTLFEASGFKLNKVITTKICKNWHYYTQRDLLCAIALLTPLSKTVSSSSIYRPCKNPHNFNYGDFPVAS
ncbi:MULTISPECIES: hypothetical protein [Fischerella]|nr:MULTISPECIES: hypothetical protein [Fischerella]MBD2430019.1 hypothetical protein [Fischerella sp. FACHB-380]